MDLVKFVQDSLSKNLKGYGLLNPLSANFTKWSNTLKPFLIFRLKTTDINNLLIKYLSRQKGANLKLVIFGNAKTIFKKVVLNYQLNIHINVNKDLC